MTSSVNDLYVAVQHERGPRNSTLRRQMALLIKDQQDVGMPNKADTGSEADAMMDDQSDSVSSSNSSCSKRRSREASSGRTPNTSHSDVANERPGPAEGLVNTPLPGGLSLFGSPFTQLSPSPSNPVSSLLLSNVPAAAAAAAAAALLSCAGNACNGKELLQAEAKASASQDAFAGNPFALNPLTSFMLASLFSASPSNSAALFSSLNAPPTAPVSPPSEANVTTSLTSLVAGNTNGNGGSLDSFYEQAARVLFFCVKWTKMLPSFTGLKQDEQVLLLENSWSELFLLIACEMQLNVDWPGVSKSFVAHEKSSDILAALCRCQEVLRQFRNMQVDTTEFACLKAISLFKSPIRNNVSLMHPAESDYDSSDSDLLRTVSTMQDQAQTTLLQYENMLHPNEKSRFGKLLLLLPLLKTVSSELIEEIFFKRVVGGVAVSKLIGHILRRQSVF